MTTNIKLKDLRHIVGYNVKLVDQESGVELIDHSPLNSDYDEWYVFKIFGCYQASTIYNRSIQIETKVEILLSRYPFYKKGD